MKTELGFFKSLREKLPCYQEELEEGLEEKGILMLQNTP